MGLRKIAEFVSETGAPRKAVVYRDAEWNEFRTKFYRDGVYQKEADSHTNDKQDALDTANHFCTKG